MRWESASGSPHASQTTPGTLEIMSRSRRRSDSSCAPEGASVVFRVVAFCCFILLSAVVNFRPARAEEAALGALDEPVLFELQEVRRHRARRARAPTWVNVLVRPR